MSDAVRNATIKALLSGAASGGLLGAGGKLAGGARNWKEVGKSGLQAGAAMGAMAGGSTYLGSKLMGAPDEDESGAFAHRGALGGAVGGGIVGAGAGALAGLGKLPLGKSVAEHPNMLMDYVRALGSKPTKGSALKGALIGGLGLGAISAYHGGDEGMQLDVLNEEMRKRKRRQMMDEGMA